MASAARIVVTTFDSTASPKITPWREHSSRVAGVVLGVDGRPSRPLVDLGPAPADVTGRRSEPRPTGIARVVIDADRGVQPAVWHLAGSNHRMLARSVAVFESAAAAVADATAALADFAALEPRLVRDLNGSALGWFLRRDEEPVIACARWYSTDRDRRKSLLAALEALVTATVAPVARVSHPQLGRGPRV
ncbi:hypothetical protein [Schumannella soli]|uniref:Uncharacterized protein n=1 Tax=Schumannella soli TaxID=2590779 RepID=A0A506Y7W3_9MICO|nr:hypothetical protein [Schumannella soli]TPW77148.1 hypothetical protein FJ657_00075 [Schumannella soli]